MAWTCLGVCHHRVQYSGFAHDYRHRTYRPSFGSKIMRNRGDFSSQSFLGPESERIFAEARVAIVGLGGGGSHIAQQLAHLGVGHFRLIDPKAIKDRNLNRTVGATAEDVRIKTPKVKIAERTISSIRPWAEIEIAKTEWQQADHLIRDAHIIFGCVDGYRQRMYLESAARRFCLPYIDIGADSDLFRPGIPTRSRPPFRFEVGRRSEMKAAAIPT